MKRVLAFLGSMKTMAVLMLVFALSSGYATFIENDFGTMTAKAEIYNARWFEVLLFLLGLNLVLNIVNFNMLRRQKALVLLFHVSFLVILLGAAVTRYAGYEGIMHIREGAVQNEMTSSANYIGFEFDGSGGPMHYEEEILLSKISHNRYEKRFDVNGIMVDARLLEYIPNAAYKVEADPSGVPIATMMVADGGGREHLELAQGEFFEAADAVFDFGSGFSFEKPVISIFAEEGALYMRHPMVLKRLDMDTKEAGETVASQKSVFAARTLFSMGETNFVLREFHDRAIKQLRPVASKKEAERFPDALKIELSAGGDTAVATVIGSSGRIGEGSRVTVGGISIDVSYGAKPIVLPFALKLEDFQLERYPGSMAPSSYASEVVLMDSEQGTERPFRIFMNNILEHRGYRFFQSSYDQDEGGTVLSVNHDPGTPVTYAGYLMLTIGMFGALFMANGRFRRLMKIARDAAKEKEALASLLLVAALFAAPAAKAEEVHPVVKVVQSFDRAHAGKFGRLIVQDSSGRMKPLDTLSTEIVNKVMRSDSVLGLNANQIVLGMMMRPDAWRELKIIRTSHKKINEIIGVKESDKSAAFSSFFEVAEQVSGYKLASYVSEAARKDPAKRNKFDKAVMQVDERINVVYMVFSGELLRLWPKQDDPGNKWHATVDAIQAFGPDESEKIRAIAAEYFTNVDEAHKGGDWKQADEALAKIAAYQKEVGSAVYVSESRAATEVWYNRIQVFERLWPLYFLVGFVLLVLSFVKILRPSFRLSFYSGAALGLLILFFLFHTAGLGMRWYISGHAPWSNGYESMIYIAWASVLAGFIFSKNSPITMASTGILSGLILFVAHLNWMDPQVTNLVPVLQSYWLSIHVSLITASYGFLGLGALLGFITLMLFILKNDRNVRHISLSIKELNAINEMSLMIGLVLLTVGNFMGGVWANESWGRYWGWDPKETWALVTILLYAVVVHLRFIKALYSPFNFSVVTLLSFSSVVMTYFGVNYYLAGMHSYAKGDPVPVPDFVPVTYAVIFIIIALAYRNRKLA